MASQANHLNKNPYLRLRNLLGGRSLVEKFAGGRGALFLLRQKCMFLEQLELN